MGTLDDTDVVYVANVPAKSLVTLAVLAGTRFPAHSTSMGRALLAWQPPAVVDRVLRASRTPVESKAALSAARARGWCHVQDELEADLSSVAVPLRNVAGDVVAAVAVSMHVRGGVRDRCMAILPRLRETAAAIEADLAWCPQTTLAAVPLAR